MDVRDPVFPTNVEKSVLALGEVVCIQENHWDAQRCQLPCQGVCVVDDELYPRRGPVMGLPLPGGHDIACRDRLSGLTGGGERRVVGDAQIVSEPDQLSH